MNKLLLAALAGTTPWVWAHDGHALDGTHWHASDAWGFVVLGAVVALALWARRGK